MSREFINPIKVDTYLDEIPDEYLDEDAQRYEFHKFLNEEMGWNLQLPEEEEPSEREIYDMNVDKNVDRNSKMLRLQLAKAYREEEAPIDMYKVKIERNPEYQKMDLLSCLAFNTVYTKEMEKLKYTSDTNDMSAVDIDSLVAMYKQGILDKDSMNEYSRLKSLEIIMATGETEYKEFNYSGDEEEPVIRNSSSKNDEYIRRLLNGDID